MIARTYMGLGKTWKRISNSQLKGVLGLYEWKQHKLWFVEECSHFLDQMKQTKMHWL
jgi:hypothetical protein